MASARKADATTGGPSALLPLARQPGREADPFAGSAASWPGMGEVQRLRSIGTRPILRVRGSALAWFAVRPASECALLAAGGRRACTDNCPECDIHRSDRKKIDLR